MADNPPAPVPTSSVLQSGTVETVAAARAADPAVIPIFHGNVSHWMGVKSYVAAAALIAVALAGLTWGAFNAHSPYVTVVLIASLALLLASLVMVVYVASYIHSTRYTITNRLIEFETGLAIKKVDALDLGRVKHVEFVQSMGQRMLRIGSIEVYASDKEEPQLLIEDIPQERVVYEKLRDAVIDLSRRRGVILE